VAEDSANPETPESVLIQRAVDGDLGSFNQILERYQRSVVLHCTGILRDASLAEDVAQETFVKAWKNLATFRGESVRSWLMRIATNGCLDLLRQRNRHLVDSLDAQLTEPTPMWSTQSHDFSPEEQSEQSELAGRLEQALSMLPEDQRVALLMSDVLGYDYIEIASLTDSAIGTVKSRISRARARLRVELLGDNNSREHFERYGRS
jgi:RNA polymerase sigma-70 factor (ECF subfamily)